MSHVHSVCSLTAGFFPSIFYYHYSVVKKLNVQLSFRIQSSIVYRFTNSYLIAIGEILFLINYALERHFKEEYILSIFFTLEVRFPAM